MKVIKHFKIITQHRFLVMIGCFKIGLFWQGLIHDISKYSFGEFWKSAKYYQGNRSPISAERIQEGYSTIWLHHKGRNKHHCEYWFDKNLETGLYEPIPMPRKFLAELVIDRIVACKIYQKNNYTPKSPLLYFLNNKDSEIMHPISKKELLFLFNLLKDKGEKEMLNFIKKNYLKRNDIIFLDKNINDY